MSTQHIPARRSKTKYRYSKQAKKDPVNDPVREQKVAFTNRLWGLPLHSQKDRVRCLKDYLSFRTGEVWLQPGTMAKMVGVPLRIVNQVNQEDLDFEFYRQLPGPRNEYHYARINGHKDGDFEDRRSAQLKVRTAIMRILIPVLMVNDQAEFSDSDLINRIGCGDYVIKKAVTSLCRAGFDVVRGVCNGQKTIYRHPELAKIRTSEKRRSEKRSDTQKDRDNKRRRNTYDDNEIRGTPMPPSPKRAGYDDDGSILDPDADR
jgi:hypothetical protein